ncbi:MAG: transposase [Alphaproteobacteria bacterium]|nr:transposase [Alphaproteobacteria bacterium]
MPKALSLDLRTRVVQAYLNGTETQQQVADRFGVGVASLVRWLRLQRESGSLKPRPSDGAPAPKLDANGLQVLAGLVAEQNDLTNAEYAMQLEDLLGITVSRSTVIRAFKRLGYTRKKRRLSLRNGDSSASLASVNATYVGSRWSTRTG